MLAIVTAARTARHLARQRPVAPQLSGKLPRPSSAALSVSQRSRLPSNERARNHWSPGSAAFSWNSRRRRPSLTAFPPAHRRKELTQQLRTRRCEWYDTLADVETDQVRELADLARTGRPQPGWAQLMAQMRPVAGTFCGSLWVMGGVCDGAAFRFAWRRFRAA